MIGVTLVRHGETTGQSSTRYYGATDVPLSDVGRAQMRCVRRALMADRFDAVYSSRLTRSVEAARLIVGDAAPVMQVPELDEVSFGHWEGWTKDEIAARDPENFRAWQTQGLSFCYPGGESRAQFHGRVGTALGALLEGPALHRGLFVVHKGVIAVILTELLRLTPAQRAGLGIDLGSIHVVTRNGSGWTPEYLDRVDHLRPAGASVEC